MPDPNCRQCVNPNLKGIHTCEAYRPVRNAATVTLSRVELGALITLSGIGAAVVCDEAVGEYQHASGVRELLRLTVAGYNRLTQRLVATMRTTWPNVRGSNEKQGEDEITQIPALQDAESIPEALLPRVGQLPPLSPGELFFVGYSVAAATSLIAGDSVTAARSIAEIKSRDRFNLSNEEIKALGEKIIQLVDAINS